MEKKFFNDLDQSVKEAALISKAYANGRMSRSTSHAATTLAWLKRDNNSCAELLDAALETGDADDFKAALGMVIKAKGCATKIADETGLNSEMLYRTVSKKGHPKLSNLLPIFASSGAEPHREGGVMWSAAQQRVEKMVVRPVLLKVRKVKA
jgi:probable addiction module antidote protein